MIYVIMTDRFMSNWGPAFGRSFYCVQCDDWRQAEAIQRAAKDRSEMRCIATSNRPHRGGPRDHVRVIHFNELGVLWKKYYRTAEEEAEADRRYHAAIAEARQRAAAREAGDESMRAAGRTRWNEDDKRAAEAMLHIGA